jgi:hypothetical protein
MNILALDLITEQMDQQLADRKLLATKAFHVSSHYDTSILIISILTKQNKWLMVKF